MMMCVRIREPYVIYIQMNKHQEEGKQQERIRIILTVPNTKNNKKGLWKPKEIQNKLEREQLSSVARRVDTLADSLMRYPTIGRVAFLDVWRARWMYELVLVSIGRTDKSLHVSARVCEPTTLIRMLIDNEIKRDVTVVFVFFFLFFFCFTQLFSV